MSVLFVDSFDHYATADFAQKYDMLGVNHMSITATGRWGSNAFHCSGGNAYLRKGVNPGSQVAIVGFAVKFNATGQYAFCETFSSVIDERPMVLFTKNSNGSISAWRASDSTGSSGSMSHAFCTLLGSTPAGIVNNGTWNYIELKVDHDNAGTVEIAVNGNVELSEVGTVDTLPTGRIYDAIGFGLATSSGSVDFDDFYIADDQGADVNDFVGDSRIEAIYPESDGTHLDWTPSTGSPHWSLVDETTPNGDTDYVSTTAPGNQDSYNYQTVSGAGDIIAVQVNIVARKEASGTKKVKALARVSAADFLSTEEHALAMDYKDYRAIYTNNPDTAAPWSAAEVNASEFGVEVTL
jgi:hypothetical protein